jgi:hypothetical protein
MDSYAELEIALHRWDATSYVVEMRFSDPTSDVDIRLPRSEAALVQFDFDLLRSQTLDPDAYGTSLSDSLFACSAVHTTFSQAYSAAQSQNVPLRLRLLIGASAPELQDLRWETLQNPLDQSLLITSERVLFSRYLSSLDWRPIRRRPRADLRALVIIANPNDLSSYEPAGRSLDPVDVDGELARARESLRNIEITALASDGTANLNTIGNHLRDGYDIVYMVNHGAMIKGEPYLWLEEEDGSSAVTPGMELVTRLKELQRVPTLVVLASCQSAGSGSDLRSDDGGAQSALGPRLAEAGIPSVLAMQENVTVQTVAEFMPRFFAELQEDGQIDRAVAAARGQVRDRFDWWVPVLFMRLKSGRIWYVPGFASDRPGFDRWPALLRHIRRKRCTPILGPGITASLLGSPREIASRWSETFRFPLEPHAQDDLPQVAQFLAVNQGEQLFPHEELEEFLRREIWRVYGDELSPDLRQAPVARLQAALGEMDRQRNPVEPHKVLANLPFPIYITTNSDNLMTLALEEAGKKPQMVYCPWNSYIERRKDAYEDNPSSGNPLVYQLFGHISDPATLVLTEDDYFDFLIGFTNNREMIPEIVRRVFVDTALLFLGFRIDDWAFKVLFRSIMSLQGGTRRRDYTNIAVQIDPEEGQVIEPEGARRYLQSYFENADISIYWGSVEDFIGELHERTQEYTSSRMR